MKHKTRTKALSWLLSLALVMGLMPGMSLTAYAEEKSGYVRLDGLQDGDILGPDVEYLMGEGYTIVLKGGGYCDHMGETGSNNVSMGVDTESGYEENLWEWKNYGENVSCFLDRSEHKNYYPYYNDEKVDSWKVVSVEEKTITLTGYAAMQNNNPYTQAVSYRQYSSSGALQDNGTLAANAGIQVEGDTVKWVDGKTYVVSENVTIAKRIKVNGTVNLILLDGATLTASKGVSVNGAKADDFSSTTATLNIYAGSTSGSIEGTGALVANARDGSYTENAGLGGDERTAGGVLNIHGGVITAYGNVCGAGIGGGNNKSHGTITIYDGTINATGGSNDNYGSAGIGGGFGADGGIVYIYGGNVTATGTGKSAGIGGGGSSVDGGSGGTVYIYGGTVTATGANDSAAGIGKAQGGSSNGTLTLGGAGVGMLVSTDNSAWTAYDGSTRARYMKTGAAAATYSVTVTPGSNMTKTTDSGEASQSDLSGAMTDVIYTANDGYYFPTNYSVTAVNGITVTRNSYTQITVSGTPTANATITLTTPTAKTKPTAPTAAAVNCTTTANNDGKLTGVTTVMEYKKSDADSWTDGTGDDITGLVPGTYYVRVKATDTTTASDNQELVVKGFVSYTVTFKVVNGSWNEGTGDAATADKTVTLSGYEGDTLKLADNQIPSVGTKPNDTYKAGSWDVSPSTDTAITAATTFTYTYAAKEASVVTKAPTAKTLTYNGSAQELVTAGTATGGTMQYALGTATEASQPYTTSIPSKTDVGTYYVWYKAVGDASHSDCTAACVTVTISASTPAPTPSVPSTPSSSDSSPSTPAATTITVPVSSDTQSVSVTASVSGETATVQKPTTAQLEQIVGESVHTGEVTIDVSGLGKEITTASIPTETVKAVEQAVNDAANDATGMTVKLSEGSVTFDGQALAAITEQATGSNIQLNLDDIGENKLSNTQQAATKDMDVQAVYDAYITSNGQRISDFKGGKATVTVPYELKAEQRAAGVTVWYVADNGNTTEMPSTYDGKDVKFTVEHFSNYVIAYDEARAAVCPQDSTCPISAFTDADPTAWYHDGVHWALENGVMNGVGGNTFAPNGTTSRAQVATMLYRLAGSPQSNGKIAFSDVAEGMWYTEAIRWTSSVGVVTGFERDGASVFDPDAAVTREQFAAMLYRYAKLNGQGFTGAWMFPLDYPDAASVSEWADEAMHWMTMQGVINGIDGKLVPQGEASRAMVATMLMRYCTEIAG